MRYKPGHKEEAHSRMVAAAGRGFRRRGFGGIGVDGLAKEAEVTSGAFYGHFASKQEAFTEAVIDGIAEVERTIEHLRTLQPEGWLSTFIDAYLGERRTCDLAESCAIQSLSAEVARAGKEARSAYQREMSKVVLALTDGMPGVPPNDREACAWALISLLSGAVTLCRALDSEDLSAHVAAAAKQLALNIVARDCP